MSELLKNIEAISEIVDDAISGDCVTLSQQLTKFFVTVLNAFSAVPPKIESYTRTVNGIYEDYGLIYAREIGDVQDINRLYILLQGVSPIPFDIKYHEAGWLDDDIYAHPWSKLKNGQDPNWPKMIRFCEQHGWIGGFMAPGNILACIALAMGKRFRLNPIIRRLAFYIQQFGPECDVGRTKSNGQSIVCEADTMSHKRVLVLTVGSILYHEAINPITQQAVLEMVMYIFDDPDYHTKTLKGMTSIFFQSMCCMSTSGWIRKYPAFNYAKYKERVGVAENHLMQDGENDAIYYAVVKSEIEDSSAKLLEAGLVNTCLYMTKLLSADVTRETMRSYSTVRSVIGIAGYTRTDAALSFIDQMTAPPLPKPMRDGKYELNHFLDNELTSMIRRGAQLDQYPSEKDYVARIPQFLTSNSAGLGSSATVKYRVKLPRSYPVLRKLGCAGDELCISQNNKRAVFYANPSIYLTSDYQIPHMTALNPGGTGLRNVTQGKAARAIMLEPLGSILAESYFARWWADYQTNGRFYDGVAVPLGTIVDFTNSDTTGRIMADLGHLLAATADPTIVLEMADFTTFDATERYPNVFRTYAEVCYREFTDLGYNKKFLDYESGVAEMAKRIFEAKHNTFRRLPPSLKTDQKVILYDALPSGMLNTLTINNSVNRSLYSIFYRDCRNNGLAQIFQLQGVRFQGDDFLGFYRVTETSTSEAAYNVSAHRRFLNARVDAAERNGMAINWLKTVVRKYFGEYLKKTGLYGHFLPLDVIAIFGKEKPEKITDPIAQFTAWVGTVGTKVSRGAHHNLWSKIAMAVYTIKSPTRSYRDNRTVWTMPPFATYYTPISMNGVGKLPWNIVLANTDTSIAVYCSNNPAMERLVDCAASVLNFQKGRLGEEVARMVGKGVGVEPAGLFEQGRAFVRGTMVQKQIDQAWQAKNLLDKFDLAPPHSMFYPNLPETTLSKAIESDQAIVALKEAVKIEDSKRMIYGIKTMKITKRIADVFKFVYAFKFTSGDELPKIITEGYSSFPVLDDTVYPLTEYFDTGSGGDEAEVNPKDVFDTVTRSSSTQFSAEELFNYITQPEMLSDHNLMFNGLIAVGIQPEVAARVVLKVTTNTTFFGLREAARGYSMQGGIIGELTKTLHTHNKWVVKPALANQIAENLLSEIGLAYSYCEVLRTGIGRRIHIIQDSNSIPITTRLLAGRIYNANNHAWRLIPQRTRNEI